MIKNQFKKLIEQGELARERQNFDKALFYLTKAMLLAGEKKEWHDCVEAIGHKLLISMLFWQKTKDEGFLEIMLAEAKLGLNISRLKNLPGRYRAVCQLRVGDVFLARNNLKQALLWYRRSIKSLVGTDRNSGYAEYLYHLGQALFLLKKEKQAEKIFSRALRLIQKDKEVRPFHRLNLESKMTAWLALSLRRNEPDKSREMFNQGLALAQELKEKHKMPARLEQLKRLKKKYKI